MDITTLLTLKVPKVPKQLPEHSSNSKNTQFYRFPRLWLKTAGKYLWQITIKPCINAGCPISTSISSSAVKHQISIKVNYCSVNRLIERKKKIESKKAVKCFSQILGDGLNLPFWLETKRWQMNHVFFKLLFAAADGSSRLLCSHICELDSWIFGENYSLICGKPDWKTALPYQIQTLQLSLIKDPLFCNERSSEDW